MSNESQRLYLSLSNIRAARKLRNGCGREIVGRELGLSVRSVERIESTYREMPDLMLARIERLLDERDKLKCMIASLARQIELSA